MTREEWLREFERVVLLFESLKKNSSPSDIREKLISKKGELTILLKKLSDIPHQFRRELGMKGNELKKNVENYISGFCDDEGFSSGVFLDLTLPSKPVNLSSSHPITITLLRIIKTLLKLGFSVEWGPLVEEDFYNFKALNFPEHHPARDMQDTFYVDAKDKEGKNLLLRTHTSPVQIRTMLKYKPPFRIISPGRVFRSEAIDATHSFVFNQIEGFYVDEKVTMCDLKWTLESFIRDIFGNSAEIRFMPSYFPFVEPGAEVEVSCVFCKGKDRLCRVCKGSGWIELLGAGMIHPNVLSNCGYDPYEYSGFAFGAGIERFTMLFFGIDDLRILYENDLRIMRQIVI